VNLGRIGYVVVALAFAIIPPTTASIVALFALHAVFIAASEGVEKAVVAELVPKAQLGTAFGWFHLLRGVAILPGTAAFGFIWASGSPTLAFALSAILAALSVAMLIRWKA
jgi:MFS-type transporter involved in bile tolerance (Atg22 family)